MGALARALGLAPATKAAGVPSISSDGTFAVAPFLPWLSGFGFGPATRSGVRITDDSALSLPTLFACVRVLSEDVAKLPLILYRKTGDDARERATDHPLYSVFHNAPNSQMTAFAWRETAMKHLTTWGNSFNEITVNNFGRTEIWPLPADRVEVSWENERKVFDYYLATGGKKRLRDGTVFHIVGMSHNGLVGRSPIQYEREFLGEAIATRDFGAAFYRNSARPAVIMEHPATLSSGAIERLATQMDQLRGSGNAGKTVIMEEGLKAHEIGVPPEDAQYIETRKLQREEIAAIYRMPQHKVGIMDHGTMQNVEQESINYVVDALSSWTVRIEQAINAFFFADEPDMFVEHLIDALLRGDAVTRSQALAIQLEHGVLTEHQWMRIENRNPVGPDRRWSPVANWVATELAPDGTFAESLDLAKPADAAPQPDPSLSEPQSPPVLTRVKSAEIRCSADFRGAKCGRLIAYGLTPPYAIPCPRCKSVVEAA